MQLHEFTTEELQLTARVLDVLADVVERASIEGHVLAAASEVVRLAVRSRTVHDPLPGQTSFVE